MAPTCVRILWKGFEGAYMLQIKVKTSTEAVFEATKTLLCFWWPTVSFNIFFLPLVRNPGLPQGVKHCCLGTSN